MCELILFTLLPHSSIKAAFHLLVQMRGHFDCIRNKQGGLYLFEEKAKMIKQNSGFIEFYSLYRCGIRITILFCAA
jgi:hypothetical protein